MIRSKKLEWLINFQSTKQYNLQSKFLTDVIHLVQNSKEISTVLEGSVIFWSEVTKNPVQTGLSKESVWLQAQLAPGTQMI